ncbi:DUF397 domain-containing protein [Streptomyces sp. NPDC058308]|uniref:DUF397 domain-containing protein n=1 Tax=Streptomyces sp. NPDC058308 TaxID=3346440 RepID=UPI0036E22656
MRKEDLYALDLTRAKWHKSSYSGPDGNCVEVAVLPHGAVALRDSRNPGRGDLRFTRDEWSAFRDGTRDGEFG